MNIVTECIGLPRVSLKTKVVLVLREEYILEFILFVYLPRVYLNTSILRRFEVIMAENQASVAALTKRLAQSNAEVERLHRELKRGEDCINEHRDLLNIMRNNSQIVHAQVHTLMEQLDVKKGLVNQLEIESLSEVESVRSIFEAKIENLSEIVTKQMTKLIGDCEAKEVQNIEVCVYWIYLSNTRGSRFLICRAR